MAPTLLSTNEPGPDVGSTIVLGAGASSSVVLFGANATSVGAVSLLDILAVDTGATAAPVLIAGQAHAGFVLTHAKDKVVFVWDVQAGAKAGLYVEPVP